MTIDFRQWQRAVEETETFRAQGRVRSLVGLSLRASAPGVRVGDLVHVRPQRRPAIEAEVVGFEGEEAVLMPLGTWEGVGPNDPVDIAGARFQVLCSEALLGRVVDGLGRPIDGGAPLRGEAWSVEGECPSPLERPRIERPLPLGIRAIDGLLTLGEGQRIGLFAGSGVGKSTLLGQIARHAQADVVITCLVGERGRELREFLEDSLGSEGRKRSVVVCATSDAPALVRLKSAHVATAYAEWFRARGARVLLMMDSLSRYARAGREVGLAAGEFPARRGYPPSVFAALPRLVERAGTTAQGSISAIYTVLVEGGDMEEPVADEIRGLLDGHIVLDRSIAARGRFPAIDVLQSLSRLMPQITSAEHRQWAARLREWLALYESKRDLVLLGAYTRGSDARLDQALQKIDAIESFLRQSSQEQSELDQALKALRAIAS